MLDSFAAVCMGLPSGADEKMTDVQFLKIMRNTIDELRPVDPVYEDYASYKFVDPDYFSRMARVSNSGFIQGLHT